MRSCCLCGSYVWWSFRRCDQSSEIETRCQRTQRLRQSRKLILIPVKKYKISPKLLVSQQVLAGNGVDRHLLGLKLQALEKNIKPHEFFKSVGYVRSSSFKLSTSQVPTKHEGFMGYGPSDPDGYGICYNPRPDDIIMSVASFKCSKIASTEDMVKSLNDAFVDMQDLLCKTNKSKL